MASSHSVTIVASPRPRVGKTLLARLLTDYQVHEGRDVAAFDLGGGDASLRRFLPDRTEAAGVATVGEQMALFDRLVAQDATAKVVDLGAETYAAFFDVAERIGFVDEARRRGIVVAIVYVLTPDPAASEGYRVLQRRFPAAMLTPLHNELLGTLPQRDLRALLGPDTPVLRLPMLAAQWRKYIDAPPFSFADEALANATHIPIAVHIELRQWLRRVYLEFRELDLRLMLADLRGSTHFSA